MNAEILLQRAANLAWPTVVCGGGGIQGESAWRRVASLPGNHAGLSAQLDELEAQAADRKQREDRWADVDARREAAQPDDAGAETLRRNAAEAYERHERERPARVEALLERIADALDKRA